MTWLAQHEVWPAEQVAFVWALVIVLEQQPWPSFVEAVLVMVLEQHAWLSWLAAVLVLVFEQHPSPPAWTATANAIRETIAMSFFILFYMYQLLADLQAQDLAANGPLMFAIHFRYFYHPAWI